MNRHVGPYFQAAPQQMPPPMCPKQERLDEIERVLKFDPHHPDKRQLVQEYLRLTDNDNERPE